MSSSAVAEVAILSAAVRTLDPDRPEATAVAFLDGTIFAVGSDAEVREVCDSSTELIDGSDMAVVPGIVDGRIHPFWPDHVVGADLTRCGTLAELHEALADERSRVGDGWVRGWGIDYGIFRDTGIDGSLLESAVGGAPALVAFMDQHTGLAAPRALELAGVTGPVQFAEGAEVVVCDGRPTGELRGGSRDQPRCPPGHPDAHRRGAKRAYREAHAEGAQLVWCHWRARDERLAWDQSR